jgi:hypothetical protein
MKLEKDVKERGGRVLLRAGTEISDRHLGILKTWGIDEAEIENVTPEDVASGTGVELDPEAFKLAEEAIDQLFVHGDRSNAAVRELIRLCVLRRVRSHPGVKGG